MSGRAQPLAAMHAMKTTGNRQRNDSWQFNLPGLALAVSFSFAAAFGLSACENVATYTTPSLVRFIDASYAAPAANVLAEGQLIAANSGQGTITQYATVAANAAALVQVSPTAGGAALVSTNGTLLPGAQYSVFLTDDSAAASGYDANVLTDQQTQAPTGISAFRFLNQAPRTGALDIYMVPAGTTLANATPLVTDLAVGGSAQYFTFTSQTVAMVITPTGATKPQYTSASMALTGGEVRTVLIMDTQLTSNPPVQVTVADDAGPAN